MCYNKLCDVFYNLGGYMKKIVFIALLFTSILGMAANWEYLGSDRDGWKYYYDSTNLSGKTMGDEGHWTWVKIIYPNSRIIDGNYFNEKSEQWVYDCNGNTRTDDEIYYYNGSIVYENTGKGQMKSVLPDSLGENLEDIVCT